MSAVFYRTLFFCLCALCWLSYLHISQALSLYLSSHKIPQMKRVSLIWRKRVFRSFCRKRVSLILPETCFGHLVGNVFRVTLHNPVRHVTRQMNECLIHLRLSSDVSHRIVQCVTRHSTNRLRTFPEWRVTRDCAMCDTSFERHASCASGVTCLTFKQMT
jgi:hypothetical protein